MSTLMAIDPGSTESAFAIIDAADCRPIHFGKSPNVDLFRLLGGGYGRVYIEMIASYGMPVGAEVFETCVWIGRFVEYQRLQVGLIPDLVKRQPVKVHHCHSSNAKDANVTQALVDRFAPGQPNRGKGTKAAPGWFYGFAKDVWQAYALAVYAADTLGTPGLQVTVTPITGEQP